MALNLKYRSRFLKVAKSAISAGDMVEFGAALYGIAMTDTDGDGNVEIDLGFDASVYTLSVKGEDGSGNAAITAGDLVYIDTDGELNKDSANGKRFGIALQGVSSGATTSIEVLILPAD